MGVGTMGQEHRLLGAQRGLSDAEALFRIMVRGRLLSVLPTTHANAVSKSNMM